MKVLNVLVALIGISALPAVTATGQSLLDQHRKSSASPYDEPAAKQYKKHDHIQVIVSEKSRGSSSADLKTDKRSRTELSLKDWIKFKGTDRGGLSLTEDPNVSDVNPKIDLDGRYRQDNTGRTSRQFELTFMVSAEIVDVRPNGTLVIEAKKERTVNEETENIKLTGEVSPSSVVNDTVRSENVANLSLSYVGTGSVGGAEKPGFLGRLVGWLWPF